MDLTIADIQAARAPVVRLARVTPLLPSPSLAQRLGAPVWLKAESLQRTGSFKVRGAAYFLHQLPAAVRARGVVAASAGNHAQGVAVAAAAAGAPCTVVMPVGTALPKERATRDYGAEVRLHGADLRAAVAEAERLARERGATYVPPFDHPHIIAGQGTLGLELLEQQPALDLVLVPVGGGGLAAGVALAIKSQRPGCRVVGVQAAANPSAARSHGHAAPIAMPPHASLADGCAVPRVGDVTLPLLNAYVEDIITVSEEWISAAMVYALERNRLVVEGAGALGLAALLVGLVDPRGGDTAVVLSGGNIDINLLARTVQHGLGRAGRYSNLAVTLRDLPGELARLLAAVSGAGANVLEVEHHRQAPWLPLGGVMVELLLETRDADHAEAAVRAVAAAGFERLPSADGVIRLRDPALEEAL